MQDNEFVLGVHKTTRGQPVKLQTASREFMKISLLSYSVPFAYFLKLAFFFFVFFYRFYCRNNAPKEMLGDWSSAIKG
jgi:hypothetical protein